MTRKYGREGGGIQQGNVASGTCQSVCTKRYATGSRYFFPSSVPINKVSCLLWQHFKALI